MTYTTRAIAQNLSVQPLIDVHRDMIEGLRAQGPVGTQNAAGAAGAA